MKKYLLLLASMMLLCSSIYAQTFSQGIKYQAVARDNTGEIMSSERLSLMIQLTNNSEASEIYYSELHPITTNEYGLFSLVIGQGIIDKGTFEEVPWSSANIWLSVAIKSTQDSTFKLISNTKLLAVPYAFHALTASELIGDTAATKAIPSSKWSVVGNSTTDPAVNKLGTTDPADLVIVTDNVERLRILSEGDIIIPDGDLEIQGTLTVGDTVITRRLVVKDDVGDNGSLATFENTNGDDGDGITIKLGKNQTGYLAGNLLVLPEEYLDDSLDDLKELINCDLSEFEKIELLGELAIGGFESDIELIAGLTIGISNLLIDLINAEVGIPFDTPKVRIPKLCVKVTGVGSVCVPGFPQTIVPSFTIPGIPNINLSIIEDLLENQLGVDLDLSPIDLTDVDFWGIPNICLIDPSGTSPLSNENEFITFTDTQDHKMGAVKAVSVADWTLNYLNPVFLFALRGAITSSTVDKKHALYHFKKEIGLVIKDYLQIGVEYSSGNGDYAEWLERLNPNEPINTGDIVGVIGGKITKDLNKAEQIMAVSYRPIVLGNVPEEGKAHLGNNIAFMGQIPVKIMGAVATGDYIIGDMTIPGYGRAVHPEDMTLETFKWVVGRAWEANPDKGPKMVNTVVGIHNGDYLTILKRYEAKFKTAENRFESLESKVDALEQLITTDSANNQN